MIPSASGQPGRAGWCSRRERPFRDASTRSGSRRIAARSGLYTVPGDPDDGAAAVLRQSSVTGSRSQPTMTWPAYHGPRSAGAPRPRLGRCNRAVHKWRPLGRLAMAEGSLMAGAPSTSARGIRSLQRDRRQSLPGGECHSMPANLGSIDWWRSLADALGAA